MRSRQLLITATLLVTTATAAAAAAGPITVVDAAKAGDHQALSAALARKADVNAPEADGTTALHWAVRAGDREAVALLLKAGANANAANRYGMTPLPLAAANGDVAMVEALLKAGADANLAVGDGQTPLMVAARTGSVPIVKTLLARGAKVNAQEGAFGQTAAMLAAIENHGDVVKLLARAAVRGTISVPGAATVRPAATRRSVTPLVVFGLSRRSLTTFRTLQASAPMGSPAGGRLSSISPARACSASLTTSPVL